MDDIPTPSAKKRILTKRERKKYLGEMGTNEGILRRLQQPEKNKATHEVAYTLYKTTRYGKVANVFLKSTAKSLEKKFPAFAKNLSHTIQMADIKILSPTYMSIMVFTALLVFLLAASIIMVGARLFNLNLLSAFLFTILGGLGCALLTLIIFAVYPSVVVSKRSHQIKNDLPFAVIHMATIAGSGAEPMAMFRLLVNSSEYKGLDSDLKRIVNYVNLFGYDVSTALKTVASTTPSRPWKDILTGVTATIESGGSLKSYLKSMAEDTMNTYRLERKKYVETLATYSDIYTAVLIAAPLLFIVTLAIINILGGTIGGVAVATLAKAGTFVIIPFLNLGFILFLNIINPEK